MSCAGRAGAHHRQFGTSFAFAGSLDASFAGSEGTAAAGASLDLDVEHVRARCRDCGHVWAPEHHLTLCEACGSVEGELLGRTGLGITDLEVVDA